MKKLVGIGGAVGMIILGALSNSHAASAVLNWDYIGTGPGDNGTGANSATATYIGNGSGVNDWTVPSGAGSSASSGIALISNTFNSNALTGGYDVTISVDNTNQTMGWSETFPEGGTGYLQDFAAVSPYLDGGTGDALSLRIDSSSGVLPAGNASVSGADLISGARDYTDLTPEIITIRIDPQNSHIYNVNFNIHEIELLSGLLPGEDGDDNWDHESVVIAGYTTAGVSVLPTLTQLDSSSAVSPTIVGNRANGVGGGDHSDPDDGINVSFGSTPLDYIEVTYELRRRSTVGGYSFGLGIGDITYEIDAIPEPSTSLLFALVLPLVCVRKRRA